MNKNIKTSAIIAVCIFSGVATSRADIIINNSLSDITLNGTTATSGDAWVTGTGVSMLNSGTITSLNGYDFSVLGNLSTTNNLTVNSNLNTDSASQRGFYVDFQLTESYELTLIRVKATHLQSSGAVQTFDSDLNFDFSLIGGSSVASGSKTVVYDTNETRDYITIDFNNPGTLAPGDYRISIGMNNLVGGGAFASYDSLNIIGNVVPEPTVASLLGLSGGIMIFARRLRKRKELES